MAALIPIIALAAPFITAVIVVITVALVSHKKDMAKFDLLEKALGSNSSPDTVERLVRSLTAESAKRDIPPRQKNLTHATIFLALGISFFLLKLIIGGDDLVWLTASGTVLAMLGLAKLVIAFFIVEKNTARGE